MTSYAFLMEDFAMTWMVSKAFVALICANLTMLAVALFFHAERLSSSYIAWGERIRERRPNMKPPPTAAVLKMNRKIMTWLFRLMSGFLILISIITLIQIFRLD